MYRAKRDGRSGYACGAGGVELLPDACQKPASRSAAPNGLQRPPRRRRVGDHREEHERQRHG
jgi:hypothetical protein